MQCIKKYFWFSLFLVIAYSQSSYSQRWVDPHFDTHRVDYRDLGYPATNLIPADNSYEHDKTDYKRNAHAHLKAIISGHHITLPLSNGNLDLGIYQTIYYAEFDGCRKKEILVKIIGE